MNSAQPIGPGGAPPVISPQPGAYSQNYPATQPGQIIIIQSPGMVGPGVYENYARLTSNFLGIGRIGIGMLSIIFTIATIVYEHTGRGIVPITTSVSGAGIWCGLFFILAGAFGVAASKHKTMCLIMTNMVLSIVSVSIFVVIYLILSALGVVLAHNLYLYGPIHYREEKLENKGLTLMALFGVLIVLGIAECVCDIWSSAICCKAVCCGYSATAPTHQVHYMATQPDQQQIFQNNPNMGYQPVPSSCNTAPGGYQMPAQGMPLMGAVGSGGNSPPPAYGADTGEQKKAPFDFVN